MGGHLVGVSIRGSIQAKMFENVAPSKKMKIVTCCPEQNF
jgi:hypothetical protein